MSWSISLKGSVAHVCEQLDHYGEAISGQGKAEFSEANPHLQALVKQNLTRSSNYPEPTIEFSANGSGSYVGGAEVARTCQVTIKVNP